MSDLEQRILQDYKVDLREINLFKLYQLDSDDVTSEQLEAALERCRKKWEAAATNQNERVAASAKKHLSNVQQYEKILRNSAMRRAIYQYYTQSEQNTSTDIGHAKQFFDLISQTKRITQRDVDFYFAYFPDERKKKKAIADMLKNSYKLRELKGDEMEERTEHPKQSHNKNQSGLVVNLFRKETILSLRKCEGFLLNAAQKERLLSRYPDLAIEPSLFKFLRIDKFGTVSQFADMISTGRNKIQVERTEFGSDFTPLVDLFNTMDDMLKEQDVTDNFSEFKLLIKFPSLSPYMYVFEELKPETLKMFYSLADSIYDFGGFDLFVTEYFGPIYDNFGIYDHAIRKILQQAEKKAQSSKLRRNAFEKFCALINLPSGIRMAHIAAYWPIFIVYTVFELIKFLVTNIRKISLVGGTVFAVYYLLCEIVKNGFNAKPVMERGVLTFIDILLCICVNLGEYAFYIGVIAGVVFLFWKYAASINKSIDWIGMERTFHRLLIKCRDSLKHQKHHNANK